MLTRQHGAGIKIRCENWYWARKVQILLSEAIGARWGNGLPIPWNTRRLRLIVEWSTHAKSWMISWAIDPDFETCPMPEWSAKALIAAYPGATSPNTTAETRQTAQEGTT
jgi:hypothetical protein